MFAKVKNKKNQEQYARQVSCNWLLSSFLLPSIPFLMFFSRFLVFWINIIDKMSFSIVPPKLSLVPKRPLISLCWILESKIFKTCHVHVFALKRHATAWYKFMLRHGVFQNAVSYGPSCCNIDPHAAACLSHTPSFVNLYLSSIIHQNMLIFYKNIKNTKINIKLIK